MLLGQRLLTWCLLNFVVERGSDSFYSLKKLEVILDVSPSKMSCLISLSVHLYQFKLLRVALGELCVLSKTTVTLSGLEPKP